jgi:hypothetical protein
LVKACGGDCQIPQQHLSVVWRLLASLAVQIF